MGPGPDDKYLEESGYLTPRRATPTLALPGPVKMASQFVPPFAIGLLMLLIVGGLVFVGHARVTDDLHTAEHRNRLRNAIEFMHLAPQNGVVDAATIQQLENLSGVGKLQWENDPDERGREIQMVQDANGRILGWFSWDPDHAIMDVAIRFLPLWGLVAAGLLMLAALSLWYVRALARELEAANERTRQVARQDPISGLPEAAATLETLEHMLARREPGEFVTLCYMDLTGFRELADTYGRPWSNELVRVAADRLRELEWPQSVLGRLGRHRFIILVCAKNSEAGLRMAQQVANLIAKPLHVHGQILNLAANIGLAQAPRDGLTSDELFRHATLAMREAKRVGSAGIVEFDPSMEADLSERRFIERELKRALDEDALEVHYQPIVTAEDSRIVGIEALLRWTHPTRGNIPPMVFVPVAEQCGLMTRLGEYVLYRAFNDAKRWPDLFLAVNLSPIQVKDRALLTIVAAMLDETGLDPKRLVLEITEGVLIDDHEEACERLEEIRQLGVRIALDDFGSGYSSLSYLQSFPFDKLKIDGSFVAHLGKLENSAFIIQAIVALGRALNLSVLAEGVETEDQRTLLRIAGCDEMQGYLFARPVPRPGIDALLTDSKLHAARTGQSAQAS